MTILMRTRRVLSTLATGLSGLCYFRALQLAPVSRLASIYNLSVLAAAFLGEPLK